MTRDEFNVLIKQTNRKLFAIAYRIVKNNHEAEDIVQDVYMKMWMMRSKLEEYNDKEALAVTMTRNRCIDSLRKNRYIVNDTNTGNIPEADNSPTPYEQVEKYENTEIINKIIRSLPPEIRDIIQLREIKGLSYKELSELNGMNINNLRVILSRARKMIKEKYLLFTNEKRST